MYLNCNIFFPCIHPMGLFFPSVHNVLYLSSEQNLNGCWWFMVELWYDSQWVLTMVQWLNFGMTLNYCWTFYWLSLVIYDALERVSFFPFFRKVRVSLPKAIWFSEAWNISWFHLSFFPWHSSRYGTPIGVTWL